MGTLHLPHSHRDGPHPRLDALRALLWPLAGAAVLIYLMVAAGGGIEPGEAKVATVAVCVLAVLWATHAWRRLWEDERRS